MKAHQQHCNSGDTGTKSKFGCNKMQCLKPSTRINKSSGNVATKCRKRDGFAPQSYAENEIALNTGNLMEAPTSNSMKLYARPPNNHSGKIKLQLFPIDETIQKILHQENHNPYLELILSPRKKISSIVQHLNTKWGSSQCAKGELMLFPYDASLNSIDVSEKWTLMDSCTAADVHVAVGSPSIFRLRYGWFGRSLKQHNSGAASALADSAPKSTGDKPSGLVSDEQKHMVGLGEFPSNFVTPSAVGNTDTVHAMDNQSKMAPLSWLDGISNISFGALLSEVAPSQDSKPLPSQINSSLQQIPVTCDSFDAAIASLIARQQGSNQLRVSNPSLWESEDTCHAFTFQNQTSKRPSSLVPGNSSGSVASSVLGSIRETATDDDQQCSTEGVKQESNTQTPVLTNEHSGKTEISMHESTGDPELVVSCTRLLSGTDSLGLSGLLTNSLDAFQNFSIF